MSTDRLIREGAMVKQRLSQKHAGAYYTPDAIVGSLLHWAVRSEDDRLLDPSCGDGRFIAGHRNAVGIEQDPLVTQTAMNRAPWALVHEGDFFSWASETTERFECAAGNPPFIRYQTFNGEVRARAMEICARLGAQFSGLASAWAPFLVATAGLLKRGGRMAFVVPAEIGHAPYAAPLIEYMLGKFSTVHIVAVRDKLFPDLSEDCWLLYADGHEGCTSEIRLSVVNQFEPSRRPPREYLTISAREWRTDWNRRLRPFVMNVEARELYRSLRHRGDTARLGDIALVGIGYVSGANDFFHLKPSTAERLQIPDALLHPTVRNGRSLPPARVTQSVVGRWKREDEAILLLKLPKTGELPRSVQQYLDTAEGRAARTGYKCRMREPWYSVPDVQVPDYFLTYMSGLEAGLVRNDAACTCTNSVHSVRLKSPGNTKYLGAWGTEFVQLSCEIEGHALGGGMLKLEPREATEVLLPRIPLKRSERSIVANALQTMRSWRHYAEA